MSLKEKYLGSSIQLKASFWFIVCSFVQKGISMLTTPIFTRLLSTDEYGLFNYFNSWLGIVSIVCSLNLAAGVYMQGLVKYEEEKNEFASSILGLSSTLIALWTVIYVGFRRYINANLGLNTTQIISMFVLIWTTTVFNLWAGKQRAEYRYKALVVVSLFTSIIKPLVGIALVICCDDKVTARVVGLALVELVGFGWLFIALMRGGKVFFSLKYWKYAIFFNTPLIPHYLSQTILNNADRIMIKKLIGDSEAGIYSLAYTLATIMILLNSALMMTLTPWIYQRIKSKELKKISNVAYITMIMVAFGNLLIILLAPEIIKVFAPKAYYDAIWIVPPVAISGYCIFEYDLFAKIAFYYEKTKLIMITSVMGAILNIVLNYIFIPRYGYLAAGYTTLICYLIYCIGHYILMNRICRNEFEGIRPYSTRIILLISLAFIIMGFSIMFTYQNVYLRYFLVLVFAIAIWINRLRIVKWYNRLCSIRIEN